MTWHCSLDSSKALNILHFACTNDTSCLGIVLNGNTSPVFSNYQRTIVNTWSPTFPRFTLQLLTPSAHRLSPCGKLPPGISSSLHSGLLSLLSRAGVSAAHPGISPVFHTPETSLTCLQETSNMSNTSPKAGIRLLQIYEQGPSTHTRWV